MTHSSTQSSTTHKQDDVRLRALQTSDRNALKNILISTDAFSADEVDVALELIDIGETDDAETYRFFVAEDAQQVLGYVCYGLTPLTDGVYDLYWIAVDAAAQGRGIGRKLVAAVEESVQKLGGRMVLIETASKASYASTRAFYLATGYVEVARIEDFYSEGDDKVVYGKRWRAQLK